MSKLIIYYKKPARLISSRSMLSILHTNKQQQQSSMNFRQQVKLMFIFTFQLVLFPPGTWRKQRSQKRQRERYQKDLNHVSLYFIPNFELFQGCVETGPRLETTSNCSQPAEFRHLLASVKKPVLKTHSLHL